MVPVPGRLPEEVHGRDRDQGQLPRDQLRRLVPELEDRRPAEDRRVRHLRHGRQLGARVRRQRHRPEPRQARPQGQPGHPRRRGSSRATGRPKSGAAAEGVRERHARALLARDHRRRRDPLLQQGLLPDGARDVGRHLQRSRRRSPIRRACTAGRRAASPATRSCRPTCRCSTPTAATSPTTTGRRASPAPRASARSSGCSSSSRTCRPASPRSTRARRRRSCCRATARRMTEYTGTAHVVDDPTQSKVVGKIDFAATPKQVKSGPAIGTFICGIASGAPNTAGAVKFLEWFTSSKVQKEFAGRRQRCRHRLRAARPDPVGQVPLAAGDRRRGRQLHPQAAHAGRAEDGGPARHRAEPGARAGDLAEVGLHRRSRRRT